MADLTESFSTSRAREIVRGGVIDELDELFMELRLAKVAAENDETTEKRFRLAQIRLIDAWLAIVNQRVHHAEIRITHNRQLPDSKV